MMIFEDLPDNLAIFPLPGALLLPRGRLPLNIFEPRYLAMVDDALGTRHRLIGMIQPTDPDCRSRHPDLYSIGCAGRITAFSETEDGRYLITLTGVSRFAIADEFPLHNGYRTIRPRWDEFRGDFREEGADGFDRPRLLNALRGFLRLHGISSDWDSIERTPDDRLITSLAMICPFSPGEKQALLESANLSDRASTMTALIEMALIDCGSDKSAH